MKYNFPKLLIVLTCSSIGAVFATVGDTPYTLAAKNLNATTTTVDYILDKSSTDGDRKITRLCTFDTDNGWQWQLFYSSTGTSSDMPDTIFPFYGFNTQGQFIKPHNGDTKNAINYYNTDYLGRIPFDNIKTSINTCLKNVAAKIGYDDFEEMLFNDDPTKQFFTRMDNLDKMEMSYGFRTGVWDGKNSSDTAKIANCFVTSNSLLQDKFVFNSKGPSLTISPGTSVNDKTNLVKNFIGYKDRTTKCK